MQKSTSQHSPKVQVSYNPNLFAIAIAISLLLSFGVAVKSFFFTPRIAYVETAKLMVGFSEAAKVEQEMKAENDKWQGQLKILQDSLAASISTMSKEYDRATPQRKKELQDLLSASNQRVNNFKQANQSKIEKLGSEKMKTVLEKINIYIQEYGKKRRYNMIFGTVQGGSILYGDNRRYDVTEDIIKGLNERYK